MKEHEEIAPVVDLEPKLTFTVRLSGRQTVVALINYPEWKTGFRGTQGKFFLRIPRGRECEAG